MTSALDNTEEIKRIVDRRKIGMEMSHKYELYFVSLIFTLGGLSLQLSVSNLSGGWIQLQVMSWACFLLSGLIGLWRLKNLGTREIDISDWLLSQLSTGNYGKEKEIALINLDTHLGYAATLQNVLFVIALIITVSIKSHSILGH